MSDPGVVMLDRVRLSGLEVYLDSWAKGCLQCVDSIERALLGTGESAATEVAELGHIATWCRVQHGDVVRRRMIVEGLPRALPLPRLHFDSRTQARDMGRDLAERLDRELSQDWPSWAEIEVLLDLLDRGHDSVAFTAAFFSALGPQAARELGARVTEAFGLDQGPHELGARVVETVLDPEPGRTQAHWLEATRPEHEVITRALATASHSRTLDETWWWRYAGLPVTREDGGGDHQRPEWAESLIDGIRAAGVAAVPADIIAEGIATGRLAAFVSRASGVVSLAEGVIGFLALADDLDSGEVDTWEEVGTAAMDGVQAGLALVSVVGGPVGMAAAGLGLLVLAGRALSKTAANGPRPERHHNPGTGRSTYSGGGQDNPRQSVSGVPLDPNMTVGS